MHTKLAFILGLLLMLFCGLLSAADIPAPGNGTGTKVRTPTKPRTPEEEANATPSPVQIRIKDLADVQGVRENQLIGQGIVIGLDGSGDSSGPLASQSLANLSQRFGVKVSANDLKGKNIASVLVTAQLPPFIKKGARLDVQVSSIGDAKSLQGGILLQTPLMAADGRVYAVSQGAISVGGFSAGGGGGGGSATVQKNHTLAGRVPEGGLVEREVPSEFAPGGVVRLRLRRPDFTTAKRLTERVNKRWPGSATALDLGEVAVVLPASSAVPEAGSPTAAASDPVAFVSELENLTLTPDAPARVVINERTGTIVAGGDVRISPTAIAHGNLFIAVKNTPLVSQPESFSNGATATSSDQSTIAIEEPARILLLQPGPTLGELARALNALKLAPRDIISIFQALKDAGALHAELVIM